ncbi:hypothetical protein HOP50_08g52800 [Chloropicon primus]|uniref:Uncharacterized protein n=1 Tax=Chloropicon primus TaxID=1764295 RepID=A0A5B8MTJ6_9CHLO|nr:hypothetical protein A3770_08p52500 [Chloropicon primus]UPR01956.1 hypothetical protein HOP50_08g52800 [Chloropicon primus]|eukprot:QDZ22732.1 hypothetical protein A3770_08p52500 [Chloropicon primus]
MDDEENEDESLLKEIQGIQENHQDETQAVLAEIKRMGVAEVSDLERTILALPDEDDLEAMVLAMSDDEDALVSTSAEVTAETLRQQIREEKLEALKHKRSGDMEKARLHLRKSKELQQQLDKLVAMKEEEQAVEAPATKEDYTQLAVKYRREGKMELARKYLRLSKGSPGAGGGEEGAGSSAAPVLEIPPELPGAADRSAETLRQQIREEKLEALKHKRSGDMEKARLHLRKSKELQQQLDHMSRQS